MADPVPIAPVSMAEIAAVTGMEPADFGACDVVVLVCSHNRRQKTIAAIKSLLAQECSGTVLLSVFLLDDGSDDGTPEAIEDAFPFVTVQRTHGGSLYWSRSMSMAQHEALRLARPRYLLWLNDDVLLEPNAIQRLVHQAGLLHDSHVIVGALSDSETGSTTYSALERQGRRPLKLKPITPGPVGQTADTFNGNVVLIPRQVYSAVGGVDGHFRHSYGDIDYGYRVLRSGFGVTLAAGHVGRCTRNSPTASWRDASAGRRRRLRMLFGVKGMPFASHVRFLRRHGGRAWPIYLLAEYLRPVLLILSRKPVDDISVSSCPVARHEAPTAPVRSEP